MILARLARASAAVVLLATLGNAPLPTPADLYGDLFVAVQQGHVFADSKTFADAVPRESPARIMAAYGETRPRDAAALRQFVLAHFTVPGVNDGGRGDLRAHVRALWPALVRQPTQAEPGSSRIPLPAPYVVPGGRFREMYYWDSYFTMLGLAADGQDALVEAMLNDFTSLVERFGHIPNGTRTYYLSRSQPPFFALMLDLSPNPHRAVQRRRLAALRREHAFWMAGAGCARPGAGCLRVVRMPDGSLLNRYWDDRDTPREESFAEDRATARSVPSRAPAPLYRDLRAAAESGWDFSSRWLADGRTLATIRTTGIVPVDLNALLWTAERRIADSCLRLRDPACARDFAHQAARRKAAIDRYLWQPREGRYADWLITDRAAAPVLSAATLYPLFAGMASPAQAAAVAATTRASLLAPGGLRTTGLRTGQQWDAPNGWAPLQWIAISGLARTGHAVLAQEIARRWIATVARTYAATGKMLQKYDVEERLPGGGGEYPLQDGFGWTNGVTSAILARYPDLAAVPAGAARAAPAIN